MKCQYCGIREATLQYSKQGNGQYVMLNFCEQCYNAIKASGISPEVAVYDKLSRLGKECKVCGATASSFKSTLFLGCPECYYEMKDVVSEVVMDVQKSLVHKGKCPPVRTDR